MTLNTQCKRSPLNRKPFAQRLFSSPAYLQLIKVEDSKMIG